jgi:hypothetical protein
MLNNPFELVTASKLTAENAVELWCDDKRLERVWGKENCFINGHRGTGKSMLFRVLQYDCQKLLHPEREPDFLSVYFSVRDSELMTEELDFFQDYPQKNILSESHFSLLILKQLILLLQKNTSLISDTTKELFYEIISKRIETSYQFCTQRPKQLRKDIDSFLIDLIDLFDSERQRIVSYICLCIYKTERFDGPLFLFDSLLEPIAVFIKQYLHKCLYILIDDADDLPESHTVILNTWIARRHEAVVFKVSTMFGYKTYKTKGRSAIQHPHDFTQYDIATRYLSDNSEDYIQLLKDITAKRLKSILLGRSVEDYFPEDEEQKKKIKELEIILSEEYKGKYSGRATRDYVYRHLSSEYVKRYLKPSHATGNYIYSGFNTIAALSSGMVRDFIICAQKMYDEASRSNGGIPSVIPANIQNDVVRRHADDVLEEIPQQKQKRELSTNKEDWKKIKNLIEGLGNIFKVKMLSEDSERRVFSFAFQDEPTANIERLLDMAISEGYFIKGFISKKEGTGRRALYVLTRRIAPLFNLDISAYSGYLSLTSERVQHLLEYGQEKIIQHNSKQISLFDKFEFIGEAPLDVENKDNWVIISPEEAGL